jgi:hypothetical protein
MPTTMVKSTKLIVRAKTQPIKSFIICFSMEHRPKKCPQKIEVQTC